MIENLKTEQGDDDESFKVCKKDLEETASEKEALESTLESLESKMATLKDEVSTVQEEITVVKAEITQIDNDLVLAGAQRKKESMAYKQLMSELSVSLDLLQKAKGV